MSSTMNAYEASGYLNIGYEKLLRLSKAGVVPHFRIGKPYFYTKETLDGWISKMQEQSTVPTEAVNSKYPHLTLARQ